MAALLGRSVSVRLAEPYSPELGQTTTYAVYVDDRLRTRAVAVADLRLSAYAGAAMTLVPPQVAQEAVARGVLEDLLGRNLHDVLDAMSGVLAAERAPQAKLHAVYAAGSVPPPDVVSFAGVPGRRLDLVVEVARYGAGRLSVVCVG